ncbi:hypothetical protein STIAU_3853, partial [Stigmatella aurantiaca DW4/3-1]
MRRSTSSGVTVRLYCLSAAEQ